MEATEIATFDWDLWSTHARICVTDSTALTPARAIADQLLLEVEEATSRFRADSEVSMLPVGWSAISPTLAQLIAASLTAAAQSDGAVDPTVGHAMRAIGYDRDINDISEVTTSSPVAGATVPGWRSLALDGNRFFRPANVEIDLGATAKAVAADWCASAIASQCDTGVLVSLGGDIATAGPPPEDGWQVMVQDSAEDIACQVGLAPGAAIATSSTVRRTWGPGLHHIVDPATGLPADPAWRSASVVAPTCAEANTISTGALVKGLSACDWIVSLGRPARLVARYGQVVLLNGWPEVDAA
ncbi:MAG: putative ApbE-like thiamine biosynthesis lipoprotein [Marmoricola sp.]|nr:putative ApbE-like thiamine biosynthesis lipoprotein [Marmoricola sp.]